MTDLTPIQKEILTALEQMKEKSLSCITFRKRKVV